MAYLDEAEGLVPYARVINVKNLALIFSCRQFLALNAECAFLANKIQNEGMIPEPSLDLSSEHQTPDGNSTHEPLGALAALWFEADPCPRWIVTRSLTVLEANAGARKTLREAMILRERDGVLIAVHPDDAGRVRLAMADAIRGRAALAILHGRDSAVPAALSARLFGGELPEGPFLVLSMNEARDFLSPEALSGTLDLFRLTPAEKGVVEAIFSTPNTDDVAEKLGLSPHTVNTHLRRIFSKLGCKSKSDLILIVIKALTASPSLNTTSI